MKKFKIVSLILALVLIFPICLTACGKNKPEQPISSGAEILNHKEDLAEVALLLNGYTLQDSNFNDLKGQVANYVQESANSLPQETLNNFATEVLKVSQLKNSVISNLLNSCKNFYINFQSLSDKAMELKDKYENLGYHQDLIDTFNDIALAFETKESHEIDPTPQEVLSDAFNTITYIASLESLLIESLAESISILEVSNFTQLEKDYQDFDNYLKNAYNGVLDFYTNLQNFTVFYAKSLIALADAPQSQLVVKSFLSPDALVEFENLMTSLVEEYGVGNQEVKSAYLNFVSQIFKHTLSLELKIKNAIDYQTFAKYTRAEAKAKVGKVIETSEDYIVLLGLDTNLRKECFNVAKKVGQAVLDNFMSDEDKNILRESADLLNQNGLGLFIKNYVDLYRYGVNFIGHALTNVTETDFLHVRETIIGKVGNGEKATALSNKFYADILLRVYNNYGAKDKLKKSFNDDSRFDSVILNLNNVSNELPNDLIFEDGEITYKNITQTNIENINSYYGNIEMEIGWWYTSNKEQINNGINELKTFIAPLTSFFA